MSNNSARWPFPTTTPTRTLTTSHASLRTATTSWSSTATPPSLRTARWKRGRDPGEGEASGSGCQDLGALHQFDLWSEICTLMILLYTEHYLQQKKRRRKKTRLKIEYIWTHLYLTNGLMPIEQWKFYSVNIYWKKMMIVNHLTQFNSSQVYFAMKRSSTRLKYTLLQKGVQLVSLI